MPHDGLPKVSATAIVADDHKLLRDGIKQILQSVDGISVIAEAQDGLEAISLVRQHKPGLLTLDMAMPYAQGLEIYEEVRRWSPDTRVIVFTGLTSLGLLSELVTAGVDGLFAKRGDPDELRDSVGVIVSGAKVIAPEIVALLEEGTPASSLTARERQILSLVATGLSNKEIATRLGVSLKTVDNHRTNLMRKLDVHSIAELLSYALREGLLEGSDQL
jgi:DNA-binding NarL/FixJ family response regulator